MQQSGVRNTQVPANSHRRNPLTRKGFTDAWFIMLWLLILAAWLFGVVYVHINPTENSDDFNIFNATSWRIFHHKEWDLKRIMIKPISNRIYYFMFYFLNNSYVVIGIGLSLSFTFVQGLFIWLRQKYQYTATFALFLMAFQMFVALFQMYKYIEMFIKDKESLLENSGDLIMGILVFPLFILLIFCLSDVGAKHIPDVILNTSRVYFRFPHLILFSIIIYGLATAIATISLIAVNYTNFEDVLYWIILIGSYYLIFFLHYFGVAVISKVSASWLLKRNKSKPPNSIVFRSVTTVMKYQLGSIAFGATIIGPICLGIITWLSYKKLRTATRSVFESAFDLIISIFLVLNISKFSLMINSAYGQSFKDSTREAFHLFKKNSAKSFSFVLVLYGITLGLLDCAAVLFLIPIGVKEITIQGLELQGTLNDVMELFLTYSYVFSIVMIPLFLILDSVAYTNYLCSVKDEDAVNSNVKISSVPLRRIT